jgi:hypothetical protein
MPGGAATTNTALPKSSRFRHRRDGPRVRSSLPTDPALTHLAGTPTAATPVPTRPSRTDARPPALARVVLGGPDWTRVEILDVPAAGQVQSCGQQQYVRQRPGPSRLQLAPFCPGFSLEILSACGSAITSRGSTRPRQSRVDVSAIVVTLQERLDRLVVSAVTGSATPRAEISEPQTESMKPPCFAAAIPATWGSRWSPPCASALRCPIVVAR